MKVLTAALVALPGNKFNTTVPSHKDPQYSDPGAASAEHPGPAQVWRSKVGFCVGWMLTLAAQFESAEGETEARP